MISYIKSTSPEEINKRVEKYNTILKMRESGKTLREIGELFGITRERVRQIERDHCHLPPRGYSRNEKITKEKTNLKTNKN